MTRYFLFLFLDLLLRLLGDEVAHPLGRVLLHLPGDVGVGIQRETCAVVPQDTGDCLGVHALLDRQRGEGMSQPVEGDVVGDSCLLQQGLVQSPQAVRAVELARHWGREHRRVVGMLGVFLNQQIYRFLRQMYRPHRVGSLGLSYLHLAVDPEGGTLSSAVPFSLLSAKQQFAKFDLL